MFRFIYYKNLIDNTDVDLKELKNDILESFLNETLDFRQYHLLSKAVKEKEKESKQRILYI